MPHTSAVKAVQAVRPARMIPNPVHRLPAALEGAIQRVKLAARASTERTIESLGLAALASKDVFYRDSLLGAQFELNRKSAVFALAFNEALDTRVLREVAPHAASGGEPTKTRWDSLSLVDDHEMEIQVSAERFALEIAHECEWELRELDTYIVSLLGPTRNDQERNPIRPEVIGQAMLRAVETVSDRPEVRKVLASEFGRSLGSLLRTSYGEIVADLRQAGVQPSGMVVRTHDMRAGTVSGYHSSRPAGLDEVPAEAHNPDSRYISQRGSAYSSFGPSTRSGMSSGRGGTLIGHVDPGMMTLIRRLAYVDPGADSGTGDWHDMGSGGGGGGGGMPSLPNLIRAHRDELRQATNGALELMVIDVIGSLFDQILSDPKVPPQMARQIARLQLPVLRAALGDPGFFSSRRHPVRRFVNRIASLGAAFEDFNEDAAQRVLTKVKALVQEVIEGEFDQIEVYEQKLAALEIFIADLGQREAQAHGNAADLLSAKEDELRLRVLYKQQLEVEFKGIQAPDFVRDFVSNVWSQVLLKAAGANDPERLKRLRQVGRELVMSVQPKTSALQRKTFLSELPKLMKEIGEGMDLVDYADSARRSFFSKLLPAHAAALKAELVRQLDFNLLSRQVEGALERPLPTQADLKTTPVALPTLTEAISDPGIAPRFTAEEAARVGLIDETTVDWNGKVDVDVSVEPEIKPHEIAIEGLPAPTEPVEPTQGKSLADHVQIGFAYQMHLEGSWQKVRLVHVSPGRTFFVFNHGKRHKQTISLTHRMLVRLCETGRLRAFAACWCGCARPGACAPSRTPTCWNAPPRARAASCRRSASRPRPAAPASSSASAHEPAAARFSARDGAPPRSPPPGWPGRRGPGRRCRTRCRGRGWCARRAGPA